MSTASSSGPAPRRRARPVIDAGTSVEVRTRFDGRWCAGFKVADRIEADSSQVTYRLRRTSDGAILPVLFTDDDVSASAGPPIGTE